MYNDGCGYFEDMYACMMNAKFQICITDWMMTPYFLLRRPGTIEEDNLANRLDGVLFKAAQRGVKIFIILFMEPSMFVNNDSQGAAKALESKHKNIKVLRHPNVAVPIIWSHH
jgi:phospholipase D1/2